MSFLGKVYTLVKQENFDGFLKSAAGLSDDKIQALTSDKPTQKIVADGDSYIITTTGIGGEKTISFKPGVEFDEVIGVDETVKSVYTVDGNVFTQVVKSATGPAATFKKEYKGDELVVTITSSNWDGVAYRYYKA